MSSLRRLWRIPGVIVGLWLIQLFVAYAAGSSVIGAVEAAMGPFSVLDDGHLLPYIGMVLADDPSVGAAIINALGASAIAGAFVWTIAAGGVITRLSGADGFLAACGRWLPAVAVTSLWHLIVRALVMLIAFLGAGPLPPAAAIPLVAIAAGFATCALDIARVQVVLHGARPFHARTAAWGFVQAVHYWRVLAQSVALSLVQWAFVASAIYVTLAGMADGSGVIGARLLALGALLAGLWRIAVVVEAGPMLVRTER